LLSVNFDEMQINQKPQSNVILYYQDNKKCAACDASPAGFHWLFFGNAVR
jgi:hypothetical protein